MKHTSVAIIGTVGVPANYGGFETLADNLVKHVQKFSLPYDLTVYCSKKAYAERLSSYRNAKLKYIALPANGALSLLYDMFSLVLAVKSKHDVILLLGHGGSFLLPLMKLISDAKFVTNIDGVEWRREKWGKLARFVLKYSEKFAVKYSHVVIADNDGIADYVLDNFNRKTEVIAYGGDHAVATIENLIDQHAADKNYALGLCRIEPENNVEMILQAFVENGSHLVFVGNWSSSNFGINLRKRFAQYSNIRLLDPIYDEVELARIRNGAAIYIHGHSAGGTNPALVEMMHFGIPIVAYDCVYNRNTTKNEALFFQNMKELLLRLDELISVSDCVSGRKLKMIAEQEYTWSEIGDKYINLIEVLREN